MLTVNHIDINGTQTIREVYQTYYDPQGAGSGKLDHDPCRGELVIECIDGMGDETHIERVHIYRGDAYVMNNTGKTVATYNLGGHKIEEDTIKVA